MNNREAFRNRVYSFFEKKNKHKGKKFTVDHFISEGRPKSTIYDILNRNESGKSAMDKKSSGRPAIIFTKRATLAIVAMQSTRTYIEKSV